jgi:hypothetical protein
VLQPACHYLNLTTLTMTTVTEQISNLGRDPAMTWLVAHVWVNTLYFLFLSHTTNLDQWTILHQQKLWKKWDKLPKLPKRSMHYAKEAKNIFGKYAYSSTVHTSALIFTRGCTVFSPKHCTDLLILPRALCVCVCVCVCVCGTHVRVHAFDNCLYCLTGKHTKYVNTSRLETMKSHSTSSV